MKSNFRNFFNHGEVLQRRSSNNCQKVLKLSQFGAFQKFKLWMLFVWKNYSFQPCEGIYSSGTKSGKGWKIETHQPLSTLSGYLYFNLRKKVSKWVYLSLRTVYERVSFLPSQVSNKKYMTFLGGTPPSVSNSSTPQGPIPTKG